MDSPQYCTECRCEIDQRKPVRKHVEGDEFCDMCFEMLYAVLARVWFQRMHAEWVNSDDNERRLRPGADYFG